MLEQMCGHGKHAALHLNGGHILGFKFFRREIIRPPGIDFRAAGVDIDRSEIEFRPGMNREMRLRDHNNAGDAVRIKGVEHDVHNSRMGMLGRIHHDRFDFVNIVQDFGIAVVKFDQQMPAE